VSTLDYVVTSPDELAGRLDTAHARFAELLGSVAPGLPVGDWSAPQVLGHLVTVVNRYNAFDPARLAEDPRGVDEINERELEALTDRRPAELLRTLADEMSTFRDRWGPSRGLPLGVQLPFHGGATIDVQSGLTNLLAEFLVHGHDVATADHRPWPIDERDGALIVAFCTQLIPAYVRRTDRQRVVHLHVDGVAPWALEVVGPPGRSRQPRPDDRPDLVVRGPATAIALLLYQRLDDERAEALGVTVTAAGAPVGINAVLDLLEAP
jgi:uncharacterized protein (TIGR03083 family)